MGFFAWTPSGFLSGYWLIEKELEMRDNQITRRRFVRDTTVATAGMAFALTPTYTVHAGNPKNRDTSTILNLAQQ